MRKFLKKNILEIFQTMYEAHNDIKKLMEKKDLDSVNVILGDCQNTAVQIGTAIESSEGEGFVTVCFLEEYCEAVYQVASEINEFTGTRAQKALDKKLIKAENSVKNDVKVRLEIVFCPYKASMWDSLESVWKAADEDPDCDAYVVPIPYYDRNPDYSFGEFHYEGGDYPDYVPITHYEAYNFEARRPDVVYIHNPYDECNYVTSVDPRFYSKELKKFTDMLVYIPYYIMGERIYTNFAVTSGIINADRVILQSQKEVDVYIAELKKNVSDAFSDSFLGKKYQPLGSPKIDSVVNYNKSSAVLPEEWKKIINGKKTVLYNTGVSGLLNGNRRSLEKIRDTIIFFMDNKEYALWWRPHPLSGGAINSMRMGLVNEYNDLISLYKQMNIGIYDDTPDLHRAIAFTDMYYGDDSSVVHLFGLTGKPAMIQTCSVSNCSDAKKTIPVHSAFYHDNYIYYISKSSSSLYRYNVQTESDEYFTAPKDTVVTVENIMYSNIIPFDNLVYMIPNRAYGIVVFDTNSQSFTVIDSITHSVLFSILRENKIYMVTRDYSCLYILDLSNHSVEKHEIKINFPIHLINYKIARENSGNNIIAMDNDLIVLINDTGSAIQISLSDYSSKLICIDLENTSFISICNYKNNIIVIPTEKNKKIVLKNKDRMGSINDELCSLKDISKDGFRCSLLVNDYLYLIDNNNYLVTVSLEKNEARLADLGIGNEFTPACMFAESENRISIVFSFLCDYNFFITTDSNGVILNKKFIYEPQNYGKNKFDYLSQRQTRQMCARDYVLCEVGRNNLKNILSQPLSISENQIAAYEKISNNSNGTAGNTIHQFIKDELKS